MLPRMRGAIVVAAALVCALSSSARADNKEAAKQAYTEGKRQYDLGEYGAALDAFKRAYLNYEEPVFLFNIAQCYRAIGDRPAAVRSYRTFLRNWAKAPNRDQVERIISELEAAMAQDQVAKQAATATATRETPAPVTAPPPPPLPPTTKPSEKPAAAMATPPTAPPPATAPTETKPTATAHTPPPKAAPEGVVEPKGMVEIEPNFERPSGSARPLKWWAWTLITVGVAGVAGAAIAIGLTESGSKSNFSSSLPDFTSHGLRVLSVGF